MHIPKTNGDNFFVGAADTSDTATLHNITKTFNFQLETMMSAALDNTHHPPPVTQPLRGFYNASQEQADNTTSVTMTKPHNK